MRTAARSQVLWVRIGNMNFPTWKILAHMAAQAQASVNHQSSDGLAGRATLL
jgi:hypothetical protein